MGSSTWNATVTDSHAAFEPLRTIADRFANEPAWPDLARWNLALADRALTSASGHPLRFVPDPPRSRRAREVNASSIYDVRIHEQGEVPSRVECWHDFFNMLCWATFPRAKAALAARQARAIRDWVVPGAKRLPGARTRERDALAMLDEGGIVVLAPPHDQRADACVAQADAENLATLVAEGTARVLVFGHALYEHFAAATPRPRAVAVVLPSDDPGEPITLATARADGALAQRLVDPTFAREPSPAKGMPLLDGLFAAGAAAAARRDADGGDMRAGPRAAATSAREA